MCYAEVVDHVSLLFSINSYISQIYLFVLFLKHPNMNN